MATVVMVFCFIGGFACGRLGADLSAAPPPSSRDGAATQAAAPTPPPSTTSAEDEPEIPTPSRPSSDTLNGSGYATPTIPTQRARSYPLPTIKTLAATLVWGPDASAPDPDWVRPTRLAGTTDPVYGTSVRRLTDATGTRFDRNTYSRRQAENADGSMFFTYHGAAEYRVYNRATGTLVRALPIHPDAEPQWHPANPNLVRYISGPNSSSGDLRLYEIDVRNGDGYVIADLTNRVQAQVPGARYLKDRAEGSPSADGSRYAWILYDANESMVGLVTYDLTTDTVLGIRTNLVDAGFLDYVSISPTGSYVLAGYAGGVYMYNANLTGEQQLHPKGDHSDIALQADGTDAYVYIDFSPGPNAGWLVSIDLDTLEATRLFDVYDGTNTSIHVSGKGYDKPGWVIVSSYNCKEPGGWACEKVFAVELSSGRILNLAHTYNCGDNYWTETHAVVNRSFTRVYFNSDAGSCGIDAEVYEVTLPAFE